MAVLKQITKQKIMAGAWIDDTQHGRVPLEVAILHRLRTAYHANIVQMTRAFQDQSYFYIEMALHGSGMDLFDYIDHHLDMSEHQIRSIFRQVCLAIQHLDRLKIIHRGMSSIQMIILISMLDIKDENVVIDERARIQLIDFGSAAYYGDGVQFVTFCGTLDYCSPEVLKGHRYDGPQQEVWART
jgi:serine/threonine protein kinase